MKSLNIQGGFVLMLELEYKCMLDQILYQNIVSKLNSKYLGKKVFQVNYYYDTEDFKLDQNNITFRIRHKEEKLFIQVKYPIKNDGLLKIRNEVESCIDILPKVINLGESSLISYVGNEQNIMLLGELCTERISYNLNSGIRIDIDKNYYYGNIDFELEIEFDENFREDALILLRELTCNANISAQGGKRERFFSGLKKISQGSFVYNENK